MGKADQRKSETFRRKVRELLEAGYTTSQIAKETGSSYHHTDQIVRQERIAKWHEYRVDQGEVPRETSEG